MITLFAHEASSQGFKDDSASPKLLTSYPIENSLSGQRVAFQWIQKTICEYLLSIHENTLSKQEIEGNFINLILIKSI